MTLPLISFSRSSKAAMPDSVTPGATSTAVLETFFPKFVISILCFSAGFSSASIPSSPSAENLCWKLEWGKLNPTEMSFTLLYFTGIGEYSWSFIALYIGLRCSGRTPLERSFEKYINVVSFFFGLTFFII